MARPCKVCNKKSTAPQGVCQGEEAVGRHHKKCCLDASTWKRLRKLAVVEQEEPAEEEKVPQVKIKKPKTTSLEDLTNPKSNEDWVEDMFTYHPPSPEQKIKYRELRRHAKVLALAIIENCPLSQDRTEAIRKLRETIMTANASIAREGRI